MRHATKSVGEMTAADYGKEPSHTRSDPLETGDQLHRWRVERGLTAKRLGELLEVTERSIHRAESGGQIGARIRIAIKLLQARIASGEIILSTAKQVAERVRERKDRGLVVREPVAKYGKEWHGELRSGADIRTWRKSVGLYVKELAELLGVVPPSLIRAEQSESPSSRIVYGVELLRAKVLSGEVDLRSITLARVKRGPRKKS
jgi:transcriptional regulator with XRE-family HTH domain